MKQTIVIIVIVLVLGGLSVLLFLTANEPKEPVADIPQVGQAFQIQGSQHIAKGSRHEEYISNPPTSGSHYDRPAAWRSFNEPLEDEEAIHNLEHGGIWISYRDIDENTLDELKTITRRNPGAVILSPRPANDAKIALASWGYMENLDEFDEVRILQFIRANKNKSPERLAR